MLSLPSLADIASKHSSALNAVVQNFSIGHHQFDFMKHPEMMGVINLSPDSWYRESVSLSVDAAVHRACVLHAQGARIIDVGAESTLAHAARVDAELQTSKLIPVVSELAARGMLVSVETYQRSVAEACLDAGALILNLTGTSGTGDMYRLAARYSAGVIICYVEGENVRAVGDFDLSSDPIPRMHDYFSRQVELANKSGVNRIFIDPGLGFYYRNLQDSAVRVRHQMNVFLNSFRLRTIGVPICNALPHAFEYFREEVRTAEPFFAVLAALGKTDLFRTHEVPRTGAVLETLAVWEQG